MAGEYLKLSNLFNDNYDKIKPNKLNIDLYYATHIRCVCGPSTKRTFAKLSDLVTHPELTYDEVDKSFYEESFDSDTSIEEINEREALDIKKLGYIVDEIKTYAKKHNVWNNGEFYIDDKDFKNENWFLTFIETTCFVINNFETAHTRYDEIKDIFIDEMRNSKFRYYSEHACDEKLYKLLYLLYIQTYIYPIIEKYIYKEIKHNYIYKIDKIN